MTDTTTNDIDDRAEHHEAELASLKRVLAGVSAVAAQAAGEGGTTTDIGPGQRWGADTMPGEYTRHYCGCLDHLSTLEEDHHDWLLGVEDRGAAGMSELLCYLVADMESLRADGRLWWREFAEFVAMHNWRDPASMYRLALLVDCLGRQLDPAPVDAMYRADIPSPSS